MRAWHTFNSEHHALADGGPYSIAGLTQVVSPGSSSKNMADQQRSVGQNLDATRQWNWMVLLGVPYTFRIKMQTVLVVAHQNLKLMFQKCSDKIYYLWHASRQLWEEGTLPQSSSELLTCRRSHLGYWAEPENQGELQQRTYTVSEEEIPIKWFANIL